MSPAFVITLTFTLLCVVNCYPIEQVSSEAMAKKEDNQNFEHHHDLKFNNSFKGDELSVSALIERVNRNIGEKHDGPLIIYGDIAVDLGSKNADPCTFNNCKWKKSRNGKVYVPYVIAREYSQVQKETIEQAMKSFVFSTCIRFKPWTVENYYLNIINGRGCYSKIGRTGNQQDLSLEILDDEGRTCIHHGVIQHELLHALGFHHEHQRSDRDQHIRILFDNVDPIKKYNFDKINTINLGTPYDYGSVMQYDRLAFSANGKPTMIAIPKDVPFGYAKEMNRNDILRVNRLYECCKFRFFEHTEEHNDRSLCRKEKMDGTTAGF